MDLNNSKFRFIPIFGALFLLVFLASPSAVSAVSLPKPASSLLHISRITSVTYPIDSSSDPSLGGAPFCSSGSLGTILCYPPSFLKKAYNFPPTAGHHGLDGTGQTIFLVDAFGYPTTLLQSDLNTYDSTFGLPATTVTILCGPTWTDAVNCPVKTVADEYTAPNSGPLICNAPGWAGETMLDVTQAHSLAPGAKIVLVVANDCYDTSLYGAEMAVISQPQLRGGIMSQSFGEPDDDVTCTHVNGLTGICDKWDPSLLTNCAATGCPDTVFQKARAEGWTVIASSGDWGANTNAVVYGGLELTPSFPSTSPLVLAAGGTQGSPYGGQFGSEPGPGGSFTCAPGAACNTGLVVVNGGATGCSTVARPGVPSGCYPTGYGGEAAWQEVLNYPLTGACCVYDPVKCPFPGIVPGYTSGGGISILYDVPSYQEHVSHHDITTLLGASVEATGRMVPDVSFNSAVYGGVMTFETTLAFPGGHWFLNGGTSAASPAWAAIIALLGQAEGRHVGFINPAIYSLAASTSEHGGNGADEGGDQGDHGNGNPLHDITTGNNGICSGLCGEDGYLAGRGYDLTTGWGTPNVSAFIQGIQQLLHGEGGQ